MTKSIFVLLYRILAGAMEVFNTSVIIFCIEHRTKYIHSLNFFKMDFVARTFMLLNSAINFIVYCAVSESFKVRFP